MPELSVDALDQLRTSTETLNQLCDSAAQTVRDAESFLEECRVGQYAEISLGYGASSPEADEPDWEDFLCYFQHSSGKFRIGTYRQDIPVTYPSRNEATPWAELSRDEKLSTFEKLPELLMLIAEKVNGRAQRAKRTIDAANAAIKLPPKKKKGGN